MENKFIIIIKGINQFEITIQDKLNRNKICK